MERHTEAEDRRESAVVSATWWVRSARNDRIQSNTVRDNPTPIASRCSRRIKQTQSNAADKSKCPSNVTDYHVPAANNLSNQTRSLADSVECLLP